MLKVNFFTKTVIFMLIALGALFFSCEPRQYDYDQAVKKLDDLLRWRVKYSTLLETSSSYGSMESVTSLADNLPAITEFPLTVDPYGSGYKNEDTEVAVEIFSSTEKSGIKEPDNWLYKVAEDFNSRNMRLSSGKTARLIIRNIASGEGYQFIASRKYVPDAFTPSNHLWIKMVEASGMKVTPVSERLVGNVAGIVMKKAVYDKLKKKYGKIDVKTILKAVVDSVNNPEDEFAMGYTNPFASSTGLNFLITVLATYANGDEAQMLSPQVVSAFEAFQAGVPFVAMTTLQMRTSVENNGSLDAFVLESQSYYNSPVMTANYQFIPFGIRHDNPLYAIGDLPEEKMEVLKKLVSFCESPSIKRLADDYGFNRFSEYQSDYKVPAGDILVSAQHIWKQKKDSGRPVIAVFLSDVSGSMANADEQGNIPLEELKKALLNGSSFIAPDNYIGLVEFNDKVTVRLPVEKFTLSQKGRFNAAVEKMSAESKTAMYDGIMVSLKLLVDARKNIPNGKPMLFALTDGQTNMGTQYSDVIKIIEGLNIPIYTIGYNFQNDDLKNIAGLTEAAYFNQNAEGIKYQIGALLNAEM